MQDGEHVFQHTTAIAVGQADLGLLSFVQSLLRNDSLLLSLLETDRFYNLYQYKSKMEISFHKTEKPVHFFK